MAVMGCLFAGGKGRRLGGRDKALIELAGRPLWRRATERVAPLVDAMVVTAPVKPDWCEEKEAPEFIADGAEEGHSIGPAGGLLGALRACKDRLGDGGCVVTVPVDAPFFSRNLCRRLIEFHNECAVVMAQHDGMLQPAFARWSVSAIPTIEQAVAEGEFALRVIAGKAGLATHDHPDARDFFNINRPEDLARAEANAAVWLSSDGSAEG